MSWYFLCQSILSAEDHHGLLGFVQFKLILFGDDTSIHRVIRFGPSFNYLLKTLSLNNLLWESWENLYMGKGALSTCNAQLLQDWYIIVIIIYSSEKFNTSIPSRVVHVRIILEGLTNLYAHITPRSFKPEPLRRVHPHKIYFTNSNLPVIFQCVKLWVTGWKM